MMGFVALSAAAIAGSWAWGAARLEHETPAEGPVIRLVQPNAGQREKWRDDLVAVFFKRLRDLSRPAEGEAAPDLVVWPETAVPWLLEREPELRETIAQAGGGAPVLLGVRRVARDADGRAGWRNAVAVLDASGEIIAGYDKRHLVPFGEYLPFHDTLAGLGLGAFVGESGGFEPGAGEARLSIPGLPDVAPQVCYETIFPQEMPPADPDRPQWIVQVTNDAWFGASAGPWQHFHQARMRAIEQGLPLARAANTGISAIIGPYGEVRASLGLLEAGAVQGRLPAALSPTLYARTGDAPAGLAAAILLALAAAAGWRRGRS